MRNAAARGLELRREGFGGDGLTDKTVREARLMADGQMSDDKVVRTNAWAARHAVDLDASEDLNFRHVSKKRLFINQLIYTAFFITFNSYKSYVFIT
jgi:hypothetical protein